MRNLAVYLSFMCAVLAVQACRQGCTNPNALNYDSKASSDDGGCMYCDTVYNKVQETDPWDVFDKNYSSGYYGRQIFEATATNYLLNVSGNACGEASTSMQDSCHIVQHTFKLTNVSALNVSIKGKYTLRYSEDGFILNVQKEFTPIDIASGETVEMDKVFELCLSSFARAHAGSFGAEISSYTITYK